MASSIAEEAIKELKAEALKKKLPPLIEREFVQISDGEGETIRIMQWNMLAYGKSCVP